GATRPHGALDTSAAGNSFQGFVDLVFFGKLAHAHGLDLGDRHAKGQPVLLEAADEKSEDEASDLRLLDGHDQADAMLRINTPFSRFKPDALLRLLGYHELELLFDAPKWSVPCGKDRPLLLYSSPNHGPLGSTNLLAFGSASSEEVPGNRGCYVKKLVPSGTAWLTG